MYAVWRRSLEGDLHGWESNILTYELAKSRAVALQCIHPNHVMVVLKCEPVAETRPISNDQKSKHNYEIINVVV